MTGRSSAGRSRRERNAGQSRRSEIRFQIESRLKIDLIGERSGNRPPERCVTVLVDVTKQVDRVVSMLPIQMTVARAFEDRAGSRSGSGEQARPEAVSDRDQICRKSELVDSRLVGRREARRCCVENRDVCVYVIQSAGASENPGRVVDIPKISSRIGSSSARIDVRIISGASARICRLKRSRREMQALEVRVEQVLRGLQRAVADVDYMCADHSESVPITSDMSKDADAGTTKEPTVELDREPNDVASAPGSAPRLIE